LNELMQHFSFDDEEDQNDEVRVISTYCTECRAHNKTDVQWCHQCGTLNLNYHGDIEHILNTYAASTKITTMVTEMNLTSHDQMVCRAIYNHIESYYNQSNERHNLPSNQYILYKVLEIAGLPDKLSNIKLPSNSTVISLDKSFEKCCAYYGWKYIPTVKTAHKLHPVLINGVIQYIPIN
jgi:hypothetical protein